LVEPRLSRNRVVVANLGSNGSRLEVASSTRSRFSGSVRIRGFGVQSSSRFNVLVGSSGFSSVASSVAGIAVNNLFRSKSRELVASNGPIAFDGFGGREGPSRTALSLIFDGGDDSSRRPVIIVGIRIGSQESLGFGSINRRGFHPSGTLGHQVLGSKFLSAHVSERSSPEAGQGIQSVKFLRPSHVILEILEAEGKFIVVGIDFLEFVLEVQELFL